MSALPPLSGHGQVVRASPFRAKTGSGLCYAITSSARAGGSTGMAQRVAHSAPCTHKDTPSADHYARAASHMGSIELANRLELSDFRPVHLFCERYHASERQLIVTFATGSGNWIDFAKAPSAPTVRSAVSPSWRGHGRFIGSRAAGPGHH